MELMTVAVLIILVLALYSVGVSIYYLTQRSKYVGEHNVDVDSDGKFTLQRTSEHPIKITKPSSEMLAGETSRLAAAGHVARHIPVLLPTHGPYWDLVEDSTHVDPTTVADPLAKVAVAYELNKDMVLTDAESLHLFTMSHPVTKIRGVTIQGPMDHTSDSSTKNMVFGVDIKREGSATDRVSSIGFGTDLSEHAGLATAGELNLALRIDGSAFATHDGHSLHGTGGMLGPTDSFYVPSTETVLDIETNGNTPLIPDTPTVPCGSLVNCDTQAMPAVHLALDSTDMTSATLKKGTIMYCELKTPLVHRGVGTVRDSMAAAGMTVKTATGAGAE